MSKKAFNTRSLFAFVVTWAFTVATLTGIVLYVVPEGRIAYWVDWRLLGLSKSAWGDVHVAFGLIFIVAGATHLYFNWKPFKAYLAERARGRLRVRKEMVVSLLFTLAILAGAIAGVPPVSYVAQLNEQVKDTWVTASEFEPPYGHAEESSLRGFAKRVNIDLDAAMAELRVHGLAVEGSDQSLGDIGRANGTSAMTVYTLIKKFERQPELLEVAAYTAELVEERFAGTGVGRKTLTQVCTETGVPLEVAKRRLADAGIEAADDEKMKTIAESRGLTPTDVLKAILIDGDRT